MLWSFLEVTVACLVCTMVACFYLFPLDCCGVVLLDFAAICLVVGFMLSFVGWWVGGILFV